MVNEGISQRTAWPCEKMYRRGRDGRQALFGEKYGDVVRVVEIPLRSTELCGGTHVKNTGDCSCARSSRRRGSAVVRRIVAVTGPKAYQRSTTGIARSPTSARASRSTCMRHAGRAREEVEQLVADKRHLEKKLEEALRSGGGGGAWDVLATAEKVGGHNLVARAVKAGDVKDLQALGDSVRDALGSGAAVLGAAFDDGKATLLIVVSDALRDRGVSANDLIKAFGAKTGARGGGKPHMAQAGLAAADLDAAIVTAADLTRAALEALP